MTRTALIVALALAVFAGTAHAQFYKGKTVTMIINYPAGGPTDIEGRIIAQHLPRTLGQTEHRRQERGRRRGVIGTNQLCRRRAQWRDLRFLHARHHRPAARQSGAARQLRGFRDDCRLEKIRCRVRAQGYAARPFKVATDIMRAQEFKALSLQRAEQQHHQTRPLSLDLLGLKYRPIPAYRGLKEVETAILQNEGQLANTSLPGWTGSVERRWANSSFPLWQLAPRGKGRRLSAQRGASRHADVRGVLRDGERRQEAVRLHLRGLAHLHRPAGRHVPHCPDAAEDAA